MRIGIDQRPIETQYSKYGVGAYWRNIFKRLDKSPLAKRIVYFGDKKRNESHSDFKKIYHPKLRSWVWEQLLWPVDHFFAGIDIFHSTVSLGPLRNIGLPYFSSAKWRIATIFDLNMVKSIDAATVVQPLTSLSS